MWFKTQVYLPAGLFSVLGHGVLLAVLLLSFVQVKEYRVQGEARSMVRAQLVMMAKVVVPVSPKPQVVVRKRVVKPDLVMKKSVKPKKIMSKKVAVGHEQRQRLGAQRTVQKAVVGKVDDRLVSLLYTAINAHKAYPLPAQELQEEGTVKLRFVLDSTGQVSQLQVVHSSGYRRLDQAAKDAVMAAQPFNGIKTLLLSAQKFTLPINFQLGDEW